MSCEFQDNDTDKADDFKLGIRQMQQDLKESHRMLLEISRKLDALMEHLGVPYKKRPRVDCNSLSLSHVNADVRPGRLKNSHCCIT